MIKVRVTNLFSGYPNETGLVSYNDWSGDSFWVALEMRGKAMMMARRDLEAV
jgi:hypothetical protein